MSLSKKNRKVNEAQVNSSEGDTDVSTHSLLHTENANPTTEKTTTEICLDMEKSLKSYMDQKFTSLKRSLQYEIKQKNEEIIKLIKTTEVGSGLTIKAFLESSTLKPMETFEDFVVFEQDLKDSVELKETLQTHIM